MITKKYHPETLIAVWYELPIKGVCFETGEIVHFKYKDIVWEHEGIVDKCIPVFIRDKNTTDEFNVFKKSMQIVFPEKMEEMTALQTLAFSALPFSHWHPFENDN